MSIDDVNIAVAPFEARQALEALRNGVPNRQAVHLLGCMQPKVLDKYRALLDHAEAKPDAAHGGLLLEAEFGVGKSHTLHFLEQEAQQRGFATAIVVVSKETPLHDPYRFAVAVAREARLPDVRGTFVREVAQRLDYHDPRIGPFLKWVGSGQPHQMLAASVRIHGEINDAEVTNAIEGYWEGEQLGVGPVKAWLKRIGAAKEFEVRQVPKAELAAVRIELLARLAQACGYRGLVVLVDEVELIARYSLLQRAKAYGELARMLGRVKGQAARGVITVMSVTQELKTVIDDRDDAGKLRTRLEAKGDPKSRAVLAGAQAGLAVLERQGIGLQAPSDDTLRHSHDRLQQLYRVAYPDSRPSDRRNVVGGHRDMRSYVRRWLHQWDMERLYPDAAQHLVEETIPGFDLGEDAEFAREPDDSDG